MSRAPEAAERLNVGTAKHPILLTAKAAVALCYMATRVSYVVSHREHINALINRGLLKSEGFRSSNELSVRVTKKGEAAKRRMG